MKSLLLDHVAGCGFVRSTHPSGRVGWAAGAVERMKEHQPICTQSEVVCTLTFPAHPDKEH